MTVEFQRRNEAQFDRARQALWLIGRNFIICMADEAIHRTPGPNLPGYEGQYPGTSYIAIGRLRDGWNWTTHPIRSTQRSAAELDGHEVYPPDGSRALARIRAELPEQPPALSYLENDVPYGNDIVLGIGHHRHIRARNFPEAARKRQGDVFTQAMAHSFGTVR